MARLLTVLQGGGWMIIPILVTSIITVALILDITWSLRLAARRFSAFELDPVLSRTKLKGKPDAFRDVLGILVEHEAPLPLQLIQESIRRGLGLLERKTNWIQTIAAIAPLLGLLGTVSGMIHNFDLVATTRPTNPLAQLSAGISEALVSTAASLVVALVAAAGHQMLINMLDTASERWEWALSRATRPSKEQRTPEEASIGS
jgi:biopolymer transport protein ExbB